MVYCGKERKPNQPVVGGRDAPEVSTRAATGANFGKLATRSPW